MKYSTLVRHGAAMLVALAATAAMAQSASDSDSPPSTPGQKMTDVAPLPAEDRDSAGAVVLEKKGVPGVRRNPPTAAAERAARAMGAGPGATRGPSTVDADIVTPVEGGSLQRPGARP